MIARVHPPRPAPAADLLVAEGTTIQVRHRLQTIGILTIAGGRLQFRGAHVRLRRAIAGDGAGRLAVVDLDLEGRQ